MNMSRFFDKRPALAAIACLAVVMSMAATPVTNSDGARLLRVSATTWSTIAATNADGAMVSIESGWNALSAQINADGVSGQTANDGLDTQAPQGSVRINHDAASTRQSTVTLAIAAVDEGLWASGLWKMRFSNDRTVWTAWENYAASKSWQVIDGNGLRKVFIEFEDCSGNRSSVYEDAILVNALSSARTWGEYR